MPDMPEHTMVTDITITDQALVAIQNMWNHVAGLAAQYGINSDEYVAAAVSLAQVLTQMIGLKPNRVTWDGGLNLLCYNDYITFGVNYHESSHTWSVNS